MQRRAPFGLQTKLAINQPGDRFEQEADRMAEFVVSGSDATRPPALSPITSASIQRDEKTPPPKPNNYDEAVKKILDALQQTAIAKQLKAKAEELGKDFLGSVEGKVISGSTLGGALAAIIATNSELPVPIPELPLDFIAPGLKAKLTWEGPVRTPTNVGLTLTSKSGVSVGASYTKTPASPGKLAEEKAGLTLTIPLGSSPKKPSGPSESEKFRAETARLAAEQAKIRESLKTPAQRAEDKAFWDVYWRSKMNEPFNPLARPGLGFKAPGEAAERKKEEEPLMRKGADAARTSDDIPPIVHEVLRSPGQPLDPPTRAFFEPCFGHDFSQVRIHTDVRAAESANTVNALAYTVGPNVVFGKAQYAPSTSDGQRLLAHELAHVLQQGEAAPASGPIRCASETSPEEHHAAATADAVVAGRPAGPITPAAPMVQRRAAPYIKKITVHLKPPQSADLEWEGTPPADAAGGDHFTVSTGKGYSDPGDPRGTCTRSCCSDALTQCAPPWNRPDKVGACCTYIGASFWTGTPLNEHNGWKWWTPVQPYYSSRGIALHQHDEVTGDPIGHGCVRMDEPNAKRIYDFSNGRRTNVTIEGRAAPVLCEPDRQCGAAGGGALGALGGELEDTHLATEFEEPVPGLEGVMT